MNARARRVIVAGTVAALAVAATTANGAPTDRRAPADPSFTPIGTYATGLGAGSGEVSAHAHGRLYVVNGQNNTLDIVDVTNPASPALVTRVGLSAWGAAPNSVDVEDGLVAVALEAAVKTDPGRVAFFGLDGTFIDSVEVGALPDMVTFAEGGRTLLVANEGEPSGYGTPGAVDPEGSISIVDARAVSRGRQATVRTIDFRAFNLAAPRHAELPAGIRLNGPGASVAQDLEPEYIAVTDGRTAQVTLQEANAVAEIDFDRARVNRIVALGTKDHSVVGAGLDPSDRDTRIAIAPWPVRGLYMPDAIASFTVRGREYLVTANEGDARDWPGFVDEARVGASSVILDPTVFANAAALKANAALGRLNISATDGRGADGEFEALYSFGARSATIWRPGGRIVWDSGDQFEQRVAAEQPSFFNSDHESPSLDNRSDNKGPEPEGVAVGSIRGKTYAFVGLERQGGFMVIDVSDPQAARIVQWANNRDYTRNPSGPDSGPEVIRFVRASDSPTRRPLVIVSNEITGTVTLYETPLG